MALFKVLRGSSGSFHDDLSQFHNWGADGSATLISNGAIALNPKFNDGFCYFLKDSRMFYIDYAIKDGNGNITERHRVPLNADDAHSIENTIINRLDITDSDYEIPTSKLIKEEIARIDNLISTTIGDAIKALQDDKMNKVNPEGTGHFSLNREPNHTPGIDSVAIGAETIASGDYSFAEGAETEALGNYSHAEGYLTTASGKYSHAEGYSTIANEDYAHAEGANTKAYGFRSHAEGHGTEASGRNSHAEGSWTEALGKYSHSEGNSTTATHKAQHVEGEWNELDSSPNTAEDRGTYVHITGIGTGETDRKNGFTIDWNGSIWGARSLAHGNNVTSSGENSYAGGNTVIASGVSSHAEGSNNEAKGSSSHTEGDSTYASGSYSHAEGNGSQATSQAAHAEGQNSKASGISSHAEGANTIASGKQAHAEGLKTLASGDRSHAQGYSTIASGTHSFSSGRYIMAKGFNSFATGSGNYKTLGFTGDANSKTYTISTSISMNFVDPLDGIEFFAGGGYQQHQIPPAPIYQTQPSGGEMFRDSKNIANTVIYMLDPGFVYTVVGSDTSACLFEGAHPLNGGTYITAYNLQNGVVIDRTSANKPAYLTVRESEIMWETHLGYCNPIFDGSGNIMYWDASYEWHQAGEDIFHQKVSRTEKTTEKLPSGSYVVGSNGLIKISSQSGSTVILEKTLSATALTNSSYDIVLADKGASGDCSFVAGNKNSASNNYAVSLGSSNTSSGLAAFTVGEYNTASGKQSLATGYYTTASGDQQVVFGKYNVSDTTSALIIGNGTSASNKKNAFTVSKTGIVYAQNRLNIAGLDLEQDAAKYTLFVNGPAFFSGTVKAAEPIKANDLTTKNYVDNNLPRMTHSWITATAGQSVFNFTTPDTGCPAVTDLANYYYVYFNGLLLIPGLHYTVSGATVTFVGWAAEAGDVCHVTGFKPISPAT